MCGICSPTCCWGSTVGTASILVIDWIAKLEFCNMKDLELVSTADHSDRLRNFCLFCVLNRHIKTPGLDDWLTALLGIVRELPALHLNPGCLCHVSFVLCVTSTIQGKF